MAGLNEARNDVDRQAWGRGDVNCPGSEEATAQLEVCLQRRTDKARFLIALVVSQCRDHPFLFVHPRPVEELNQATRITALDLHFAGDGLRTEILAEKGKQFGEERVSTRQRQRESLIRDRQAVVRVIDDDAADIDLHIPANPELRHAVQHVWIGMTRIALPV